MKRNVWVCGHFPSGLYWEVIETRKSAVPQGVHAILRCPRQPKEWEPEWGTIGRFVQILGECAPGMFMDVMRHGLFEVNEARKGQGADVPDQPELITSIGLNCHYFRQLKDRGFHMHIRLPWKEKTLQPLPAEVKPGSLDFTVKVADVSWGISEAKQPVVQEGQHLLLNTPITGAFCKWSIVGELFARIGQRIDEIFPGKHYQMEVRRFPQGHAALHVIIAGEGEVLHRLVTPWPK
jgi:hypothetical protein